MEDAEEDAFGDPRLTLVDKIGDSSLFITIGPLVYADVFVVYLLPVLFMTLRFERAATSQVDFVMFIGD